MMNKISGLCRALYIVIAIVAAFVTLGAMDTALVLVVLGLVAGISMTRENMIGAGVTVLVLPILGTALAHIPTIGAQLAAVTANLQMGVAGACASALAIALYHLTMDGLTGLTGAAAGGGRKKAAA